MSLYECLTPGTDHWIECNVMGDGCGRQRRINKKMDPVLRLEQYKLKLEAGQELNSLEQQDLEEIAKNVQAIIESFMSALQESFEPIMQAITTALRELWEALPEPMRVELMEAAAPRLEFKLGEVATPYSPESIRVFGRPYDDPYRSV